jgi:hypothetical protein
MIAFCCAPPAALARSRRRIGQHRQAAEAHRDRLVGRRAHHRRRLEVELILVGAGILEDEHVHRRHAPVLAEADFDPRQQRRPRAADEVLLFAADPHHHGRAALLREEMPARRR